MFCSHCGKAVKENAEFCAHCGKPLKPGVAARTEPAGKMTDADKLRSFVVGCIITGVVLAVVAVVGVDIKDYVNPTVTPTATVSAQTKPRPTVAQPRTVQVSTFISAFTQERAFRLTIPTGNTSTCVWTWAAGTGQVPYSHTSQASPTSPGVHVLSEQYLDAGYDFEVTCVDDLGGRYVGIFPKY